MITVLKQTEEGEALILRAYERATTATRAAFRLPDWGREFHAGFGPADLKTFRIPPDPASPVT